MRGFGGGGLNKNEPHEYDATTRRPASLVIVQLYYIHLCEKRVDAVAQPAKL